MPIALALAAVYEAVDTAESLATVNLTDLAAYRAIASLGAIVDSDAPIITPAGRWIGETDKRAGIVDAVNGFAQRAREIARAAANDSIWIAAGMNGFGKAAESARTDAQALENYGYAARSYWLHDSGRPIVNALGALAQTFRARGADASTADSAARIVIRDALRLAAANAAIVALHVDVSGEGSAWRVRAAKPTGKGTAQYVIQAPGIDGLKSLGAWIAEECGGRYVHTRRGYVIGPRGLAKFRREYRKAIRAHDAAERARMTPARLAA